MYVALVERIGRILALVALLVALLPHEARTREAVSAAAMQRTALGDDTLDDPADEHAVDDCSEGRRCYGEPLVVTNPTSPAGIAAMAATSNAREYLMLKATGVGGLIGGFIALQICPEPTPTGPTFPPGWQGQCPCYCPPCPEGESCSPCPPPCCPCPEGQICKCSEEDVP